MGIPLRTLKLHGLDDTYVVPARNLLDNSDFRNPVNRNGQTAFSQTNQYWIDRWRVELTAYLDIKEGCIGINAIGNDVGGIAQAIANHALYDGKKLTLAVCARSNGGRLRLSFPNVQDSRNIQLNNDWNVYTLTTEFKTNGSNVITICAEQGCLIDVQWAALYEGEYTVDTLPEYQPKGYDYEMLICSQYDPKTDDYVGVPTAGYPNASMNEIWGNWGVAKEGKFDYYAYLHFTLYENDILDVVLRGSIHMENPPTSSFDYGIDTTAIMQKINEWTGKNFTTWHTQRTLHMDLYDASTGLPLVGITGHMPYVGRRAMDGKVYLQFGRVHTLEGATGLWPLSTVVNATSNGSAYLNLTLRAKVS